MKNEQKIESLYNKSLEGINSQILSSKDYWYNYVLSLSIEFRVVYTISILHQQVLNGGFHQYFFNPYGIFSYLTIDSLNKIKAFQFSELLSKAILLVNEQNFELEQFQEKVFNRRLDKVVNFDDDLCDLLEELDEEYYKIEATLVKLLEDYLQAY